MQLVVSESKPKVTRVEQPMRPKIRPRSGALVMKALLVLNNYSPNTNKLTGHRKHA